MDNNTSSNVLDVIIIGAGAAGLQSGYDLLHSLSPKNISFQILEANDRIGGRLKKSEAGTFANIPIDLGGEWIHVPTTILDELTNDPDMPYEGTTYLYEVNRYAEWYPDDGGEWYDETFQGNGVDSRFYNSTWFDFFNDYIANDLLNEKLIDFNCTVTTIDYDDSSRQSIDVQCDNGNSYQSKYVIVTVPIPALKRGDITFVPSLPSSHVDAINNARYFPGLKVFLQFTTEFYDDFDGFGIGSDFRRYNHDTGDRYFWNEADGQPTDENILGFFAVGTLAEQYTDGNLSDDEIIQSILEELDNMFNGEASSSFIKGIVQNWSGDNYALGAYSNYRNYRRLETLRQPIIVGTNGNTIYLAGEAIPYIDYEHGFAHGAALSGRSVVEHIMDVEAGRRTAGTIPDESGAGSVFAGRFKNIFQISVVVVMAMSLR